jgi:hypothetical protein
LICIADIVKDRIAAGPSAHHVRYVQVVVRIRRLKPGATNSEVEVNGVFGRQLTIDTIENIDFVTFIMEDRELGGSRKRPVLRPSTLNKVAPVLSAIA